MVNTPIRAHMDPMRRPNHVWGVISPYPMVVIVTISMHIIIDYRD